MGRLKLIESLGIDWFKSHKISPHNFTLRTSSRENYVYLWCEGDEWCFDGTYFNPIGWCFSCNLYFMARPEGIAVMFESKTLENIWQHVYITKNFFKDLQKMYI
jgi:hypothetical protein